MQIDSKNRQFRTEVKAPVMDEPQSDQKDIRTDADPVGSAEVIAEQKENCETIGVVTNCLKLNIREEPNSEAKILTVAMTMTEVIVDTTASDECFYKVCVDGVQGFCMKKFITLRH